jgi:hypothetical protein
VILKKQETISRLLLLLVDFREKYVISQFRGKREQLSAVFEEKLLTIRCFL